MKQVVYGIFRDSGNHESVALSILFYRLGQLDSFLRTLDILTKYMGTRKPHQNLWKCFELETFRINHCVQKTRCGMLSYKDVVGKELVNKATHSEVTPKKK